MGIDPTYKDGYQLRCGKTRSETCHRGTSKYPGYKKCEGCYALKKEKVDN